VGNNAAGGHAVWNTAGADDGLRQAFESVAYSLYDSGHGAWRGVNASPRFTLEFNTTGAYDAAWGHEIWRFDGNPKGARWLPRPGVLSRSFIIYND
jgi:hypothetical protein